MEPTSKTPWKSVALYLCLVLMASLCSAADVKANKTINVKNSCGFNLWPAIFTSHPKYSIPQGFPPLLKAGESHSATVDLSWEGEIWARQGCTFDEASGRGHCESGDCRGKLRCQDHYTGNGLTVALFSNGSSAISLVDGFGIPMSVVPSSSTEKCGSQKCTANVAAVCPKQLQVKSNSSAEVIGCKGTCENYFNTCTPPEFGTAFRPACPNAFPFQSLLYCFSSTHYTLTFCPKS